ncbi:MAG: DNA translocase FtsK [Bacteroidia bacterium]|nr:MAG: DNA translocase FtsK [Bacteroidia bacterium]
MAKTKNKIKTTPLLEETYVEDTNDETFLNKNTHPKKSPENNSYSKALSNAQSIYNELKASSTFQIIIGGVLLFIAIFIFISFISYFYTWKEDFDEVTSSFSQLFSFETNIENWGGAWGALIAHILVYKFFGWASAIIPISIFIWGINKIRLKPTSFNLLLHTFFWLIWLSLSFNFIFQEKYPIAGGNYGEIMNVTFIHYIGKWGLIGLLLCSLVVYFILNPQYLEWTSWFKLKMDKNTDAEKMDVNIQQEHNLNETITNSNIPAQNEVEEKEDEPIIITEETSNEISFTIDTNKIEEPSIENSNEPKFTIEQPVESNDKSEQQEEISEEKTIEEIAEKLVEEQGEFNPLAELSDYVYPTLDLLNDYGSGVGKINQEELLQNKDKIIKTLRNYGIEIQEIKATIGPTVTLYEIVPAPGIRIARIKNLEDDIALSLAALGIRIIAPMPGKGTIGIEVPNQHPEIVSMKNVLSSEKFQNTNFELPVVLGKTINNEVYIADLAKMPHLLMAGATGQGKSVGINAILLSLLYKKHPAELKLVLVDPKKVELTLYNKIERHFLAKLPNSEESIITDTKKVIHTLNSLTIEMDNRYALLQDAQVRNIKEYNQKFIKRRLNPNDGHRYLPYIVVIIDEFADLIMTAGKEVEGPIARLAQLARAVGIHLVIATQRPSVNIITGVIKANFPARIAFKVSSKIDSRTILDSGGAEQLIGRGDMLYSAGSEIIRLQCAFVDTPEVEKVAEFIGIQRGYPSAFLLPEYADENEESNLDEIDLSERDKLFDEAARLVVQFQQGSVSFLQRKLKIGFNRAGRLIDELEKAGVVGKFEGSKQREVLIKDMQQLEELLKRL